MKIKTINVLVNTEYGETEIHSYFIADNLPATKINQSIAEAYDKFRTSVEEVIAILGLDEITEEEMATAMENEIWNSRVGITVEIQRSEV